jgi:hypothetical protein
VVRNFMISMLELSPFTDPEADGFRDNYDATDGGAADRDVDFFFDPESSYDDGAAEDGKWPMGMETPACLVPLGAAAVDPMSEFESDMGGFTSVVDRHRAGYNSNGQPSRDRSTHNVAEVGEDGQSDEPTAGGGGGVAKPPNTSTPPTGGELPDNEGEGEEGGEVQDPRTNTKRELTVTFDLDGRVLSSMLDGVDLSAAGAEPAVENPLGVVRDVGSTLPGGERDELLTRRRLGRTPPRVTVPEDVLERVVEGLRNNIAGQDDPNARRYVYVPEVTPEDIAAAGGDPWLALARKAEQIDHKNGPNDDAP